MSKVVSFISTGQGPRDDIMYEMIRHLSPEIVIREVGAFDDFALNELDQFAPKNGEESTVSRVRDMTMFEFTMKATTDYVQKKIDEEVAAGTDMVVILCTSEFPPFRSEVPILDPYELIHKEVAALKGSCTVGTLFPYEPYEQMMADSWNRDGIPVVYKTVPSADANKEEYIDFYRNAGVKLLVMDCISYKYESKKYYAEKLGVPVIHPKSLIISTIHNILALD